MPQLEGCSKLFFNLKLNSLRKIYSINLYKHAIKINFSLAKDLYSKLVTFDPFERYSA